SLHQFLHNWTTVLHRNCSNGVAVHEEYAIMAYYLCNFTLWNRNGRDIPASHLNSTHRCTKGIDSDNNCCVCQCFRGWN
ncbi:hypothetical protein HDU99_010849, partial [Rhizoclosmatium hyalinum]